MMASRMIAGQFRASLFQTRASRITEWICGAIVCLTFSLGHLGHAQDKPQGLHLRIESAGGVDHQVWSNAQLHVASGEPASPFVSPGRFTATWEGFVSSELRSTYGFHLELRGEALLEINGKVLWQGSGDGTDVVSTETLRLGKGENALLLRYTAPEEGDAFVRLSWSSRDTPRSPIPYEALTYTVTADLEQSLKAHKGRDLFVNLRCGACHAPASPTGMPELSMDAPDLTLIGSRRKADWLARWIQDPHAMRTNAFMPRVLHSEVSGESALSIATYLASLKSNDLVTHIEGDAERGRELYEHLHCSTCHGVPGSASEEPVRISLENLQSKFTSGALASFLLKPEAHYRWIRMPNFRLSGEESGDLTAYLFGKTSKPDAEEKALLPVDEEVIAKGRKLVGSTGCLNCHSLAGSESVLKSKSLADLNAAIWGQGCISATPPTNPGAGHPWYPLQDSDRAALKLFAETDRTSLARHTSADFLERYASELNCRGCHGGLEEEFPAFDILRGKLKPEWAARFIAGEIDWKPRPWIHDRMPGFPAYAVHLAEGLATVHGLPAKTPVEPPSIPEDAEIGRILTSAAAFSCVSCHSVGDFGATQVFEAPGIDLAHSFERLQPDYFKRWLVSPITVDSTTKMPGFFDSEGRSPLNEYYDGDGVRTIQAMWEYMKLGRDMPAPQ